jgi:group II intron reverse transcriptase/maturase
MGLAWGRDCLNDTREGLNFVPYSEVDKTTKFKLTLIAKKAAGEPKLKFTSLTHLLNVDYLLECFSELKSHKAPGIDKRTTESYELEEITQALTQTVNHLKDHTYRPQPVRRVFIPKANGKTRPLGIPTVIDKVLQLGCAKILEPLFEPLFLNLSYGFRPNRNAHQALAAVNHMVMGQKVNWVIDADIKGFFDNVNHDWLIKCLEQRITDPNFLWLIRRFLKAGVMAEGKLLNASQGTPQGGIISPILANIYLHYVLDLWFEVKEKKQLTGYSQLIRYADDFIIGVQTKQEGERILKDTRERVVQFGLTLAEDKTRILEFGRFAKENSNKRGGGKPQTFDFLGFTHYCSKTRDGRFALKITTSRKKFTLSLVKQKEWFRVMRNKVKLPKIWKILALKMQGHYQYYGISGNFDSIKSYYQETTKQAYKWLNRRSQKKTWNWDSFGEHLKHYPLPQPKLTYVIYNTW